MMNAADIAVVNVDTGRHRVLTARQRLLGRASALFAGRSASRMAFVQSEARVQRPGASDAVRARGVLARDDSRRGSIARRRVTGWSPDGAALYFLIEDRGRQGFCGWASIDAMPAKIATGGTIGGFALSRDGRRIVVRSVDACRIRRRCSRSAATARANVRSTRPIELLMSRIALGATREVTVKGWGGEPVQVWVTYPPNFDPQEKVAAAEQHSRWTAFRAYRRLAFSLEHAGLRRAGIRRRAASTTTARRASASAGWRRSPATTASRNSPTPRPRPISCCARATSIASAWWRAAAATAATWSPT